MGGILFFLLLLASFEAISLGLIVDVRIPPYKERGEHAELQCLFSLDTDSVLYSVKWYKEDKQFYAYIPRNRIPKSSFDIPYLDVDLEASNEGSVILRNLSLKSSGTFKCEVITEAPHFYTELRNGNMTVIDLPESAPILDGVQHSYLLGEEVNVNCTSLCSMPAATLVWYINDAQVNDTNMLIPFQVLRDKNSLETVKLGLRFAATRRHFQNGTLRLKCKAQIGNIYFQSQETVSLSSTYKESKPQESSSPYGHYFFSSRSSSFNSYPPKTLFQVLPLFLAYFVPSFLYFR